MRATPSTLPVMVDVGTIDGRISSGSSRTGHFGLPTLQVAYAMFRRPVGVHLLERLSSVADESLNLATLTAIFSGILVALQLGRFLARFGTGIGSGHVIGRLTGIGGTL